jgi:hypothetical protein
MTFGAAVYTSKLSLLGMLFYSPKTIRITMIALGWSRRSANASYSKYNGSATCQAQVGMW